MVGFHIPKWEVGIFITDVYFYMGVIMYSNFAFFRMSRGVSLEALSPTTTGVLALGTAPIVRAVTQAIV